MPKKALQRWRCEEWNLGLSDALEPPNDGEDLGRNRKPENRGHEEHEEEKQHICFLPHEERTPHPNAFNGSHFGAEEDDSPLDLTDGSQYTYLTSTPGPPPRPWRRRSPSPFQQISWGPWEQGEDDSLSLHARGLAVASFSRHSEARADESTVAE